MAKKALKSAKIEQNNLIHIVRPLPPLAYPIFKINNIHIKEFVFNFCNKTPFKFWPNSAIQIVMKLKNSNSDKKQKNNLW